MNDTNKLASQIAKDLLDLAEAEFDVAGFRPHDVHSVVRSDIPNQFLVEASMPDSESPRVWFKVTIEPVE